MKLLLSTIVLFSGLVAGLFYSYSCSVNPGLKALSDTEYLKAMQSINSVIQNPVFFSTFMGLLLLFPVTLFKMYTPTPTLPFYLFTIAMAIYFIGVFGITVFCNVPLNEQLAQFSIGTATPAEIAAMRSTFEEPWNAFHTLRTIASVLSFGLLIAGLLLKNNPHETF